MNKLSNYLVEQLLNELNQGVTVMLPGGFKPPHAGHLQLAKKYASQPNVSEVTILIGPKEREGITMKQSMDIWQLLLGGASGIRVEQAPNDNPLRAAYEFIEQAPPGTYTLGSSSKGKDYDRVKMFVAGHANANGSTPAGKYNRPNVNVVELPVDTAPMLYQGRTDDQNGLGISASTLRRDLATQDFANFKTNYPGISESVVKSIYAILTGKQSQQLSEVAIDEYVQKFKVRFRAFVKAMKAESVQTKEAFSLLLQAAGGKKKLTPEEKTKIGDQLKDTLRASGLVAATLLPGGTIFFILVRLLKLEDYVYPSRFLTKNAASAGIGASLLEDKPIAELNFAPKAPPPPAAIQALKANFSSFIEKLRGTNRTVQKGFSKMYKSITKIGNTLNPSEYETVGKMLKPLIADTNIPNVTAMTAKEVALLFVHTIRDFKFLSKQIPPEMLRERSIISEGGAAGHMPHPFDDLELTFNDAKKMIEAALSGKVEFAQEKLDGQNLMMTYKDGRALSARKKSQFANQAATAYTKSEFIQSGAGWPDNVKAAFFEAFDDLAAAIEKLPPQDKEKFFENGKKFVNFEVIYPGTTNVVPYGSTQIRLHGFKEYDQAGNIVNEDSEGGVQLQKAIESVQASNQKTYEIRTTDPITLNKTADYEKQKDELLKQLDTIRKNYKLGEQEKMSAYFQAWWKAYIEQRGKELGYEIPDNTLQLLVNRWGFGDKSTVITKVRKEITSPEFSKWVDEFDKNGSAAQQKEAKIPIENLFLKLGVYVLQNIQTLVALNPNDSVQQIRNDLATAIRTIRTAAASQDMQDDGKSLQFLKRELQKLQDLGGFESIVPLEGVVFKYNGKLYKLTGAFAPINQIIGYIKFDR